MCDVVVDADFARCLLGVDKKGRKIPGSKGYDVFKMFFDRLGKTPVFSSYVFDHELCALGKWIKKILKKLKDESYIKVYGFTDLSLDINDPTDRGRKYYDSRFKIIYKYLNFSPFPDNEDVFYFTMSGCSLGEIHSIILAEEKGYDLFFSNDNGSKNVVREVLMGSSIRVVTITDGLLELKHSGKEMPRRDCEMILCGLAQETQRIYFGSR